MQEELKNLLPCLSQPISTKLKKDQDKSKKKQDNIMDKEVLTYTNGLFPIQPYNTTVADKNKLKTKWVYVPIKYSNQVSNIYHWVPQSDENKIFQFEKYHINSDIIQFSEADYNQHLSQLDDNWTKKETLYLWDLLERFQLRFMVIYDRYDPIYNRSIEEIKQRYYSICTTLLALRDNKSHPLYNYTFNIEYEKTRKYQLEKFIARSKDKNEDEQQILDELKKLDTIIKKEEKEQLNLQKVIKSQFNNEIDDDLADDNDNNFDMKQYNENKIKQGNQKICYLRGQIMHTPLPIPQKLNKKLNFLLGELNIPSRPIPTSENEELYDLLREKILVMFTLQKHLKKKEIENKLLEDKLNVKNEPNSQIQQMKIYQHTDLEKRRNPYYEENQNNLYNKKINK